MNNQNINLQNQNSDINYDIDIKKLFFILKSGQKIIFGFTFFLAVLAVIFLLLKTPIYTASSVMQINVKAEKIVDFESVVSGISADDAAIQSEVDILNSRYLASKVIDKLDLLKDVEFNSSIEEKKNSWLSNLFSLKKEVVDKSESEKYETVKTKAIDVFLKKLKVSRKPRSYTINISFDSSDPKKVALIANTIMDEYLLNQLTIKFNTTKRANDWLNNKIDQLCETRLS